MVSVVDFFSALGFFMIVILLFGGLAYWIGFLFQKYKYHLKYKIFKRDYDEGTVEMLMTSITEEEVEAEFFSRVIRTGMIKISEIKEMKYVYDELKSRMKGGLKHE